MRFFIYRVDKPGHEELRMATRPAHLDYARALGDKLVLAGPTFTDDGETMNGSVFLLDAEDRRDADAITAKDPYEKAGLFETKIIRPFRQTMPE